MSKNGGDEKMDEEEEAVARTWKLGGLTYEKIPVVSKDAFNLVMVEILKMK